MLTWKVARELALSQPEALELDHFGSPSFRVHGKIFAQLSAPDAQEARALLKLSAVDQGALTLMDPDTFIVVPQWGRHGWTYIQLTGIDDATLNSLYFKSWQLVAPKKLVGQIVRRTR